MILAYVVVGSMMLSLGSHALAVITDQNLGYTVDVGSFPVNGLLLFFFAGFLVDQSTKKLPKWVGWALLVAVIGVLLMVFRFLGGYRTIFG